MAFSFGTDGLRGVANVEITVELATALGRAFVRVVGTEQPFVVGRDTRRSGPMLEAAFVAGLCAEGADVELAGVLPTPGVAALARARGAAGAIVSASHNPFGDNGLKLLAPGGRKIGDQLEAAVEDALFALAEDVPGPGPAGEGVGCAVECRGGLDEYVAHLVGSIGGRTLHGRGVVVDCANGAATVAAPLALRALGATVDVLHATPDGRNINDGCGSTDPSSLAAAVVESGAEIGLAFDGDADRVVAVDEHGAVVDGDQILAVAALDLLDRGLLRQRALATTVMANLGLSRALAPYGIELVTTPVGDRHVLDAMEARGLALGGEQSGHLIFADHATTGDGILTGILLADIMGRRGRSLSELASVFVRVPQVLRNVVVDDAEGVLADPRLRAGIDAATEELAERGRVVVRASGTEPMVRIMVEATDAAEAEAATKRLVELVHQVAAASSPAVIEA
jgi:phosphoglucosamine mutase